MKLLLAAVALIACTQRDQQRPAAAGGVTEAVECTGDPARVCPAVERETPLPVGTARLSGLVIDGDTEAYRRVEGAIVSAWPAGAEAKTVTIRSAADGAYAFRVPIGAPVFLRADVPGYLAELHAAETPAEGRTIDLDVRHAAFFDRILAGAGRRYDASKAIVVVELIGASRGDGGDVRLTLAADPPLVMDAAVPGVLLVFTNVAPGTARVDYGGTTCHSQARAVQDWPVVAGLVTQIDAICSAGK